MPTGIPIPEAGTTPVHDPRDDPNSGYYKDHQLGAPADYGFSSGPAYTPGGGGGIMDTAQTSGNGDQKGVEVPIYKNQGWAGPANGTPAGQSGGMAGGQQTFQPGGFAQSDIGGNYWTTGAAFDDPNAAQIYNLVNAQLNQRANQSAPMAAFTALGAANQYGGANVGPVAGAGAAQAAPSMMVGGAQIAPQMMVNAPTLNTAQDQQLAAGQMSQMNALAQQAAGQGPSVAVQQAKQQRDANIAAQLGALGSARGSSNPALAQRAAQQQATAANIAAAQQGALGRSQEALSAQQQLTGAMSGSRSQDQATATQQAALAAQANVANQSAFNAAGTQSAQLQQQAALSNQQTAQQAALQNAQMQQAAGQFNAGQSNTSSLQQAQLAQQAGLGNQQASNQFALQSSAQDQQTNLANLQAQQAQNALNEQTWQSGMAEFMGQNQQDISNSAAYQQLLAQEQMTKAGIDKDLSINNTNNAIGLGASALGAAAMGAAALSDERAKTGIKEANQKMRAFLNAVARMG